MQSSEEIKDKDLQEYIKELVIARINALSKDLEISVGGKYYPKADCRKC